MPAKRKLFMLCLDYRVYTVLVRVLSVHVFIRPWRNSETGVCHGGVSADARLCSDMVCVGFGGLISLDFLWIICWIVEFSIVGKELQYVVLTRLSWGLECLYSDHGFRRGAVVGAVNVGAGVVDWAPVTRDGGLGNLGGGERDGLGWR